MRSRLLLMVALPSALAAQEPAPPASPAAATAAPVDGAIGVTSNVPAERFISAETPIVLTLTRPLAEGEGRVAIVIGGTDVSALVDATGATITYRPRVLRLPRGESEVVVYQVTARGASWSELARFPLKVLAAGGFTSASTRPSALVNLKGQLAEGHSADVPPPDRPTYQDVTLTTGLQSTHARGAFAVRTQANFVGASRREEALRFAQRQGEAPRFDLSDYVVQLERGRASFSLGHVATGLNRHLVSGFTSRGVSAGVRGSVANLSVAAMNGSSIVGFDNLAGLDNGDHRVYSAALGLELLPRRPGALHVDATLLDGSLLPQTSFTQGAVVDAERSRGGGVQLSAATPSQRLRLAAGLTRSRFDNPNRDAQLLGDTSVVPVREETRSARYAEVNAGVLQNVAAGTPFATTLNAGYRHERVDPLYRSVAAFTQADREQHAFDVSGSVGALSLQVAHGRGHDNLDDLPSVLTTHTRTSTAMVSAPLASLFRVRRAIGVWPQLAFGLNRTHQFGEGVPPNSDFSASHVPDQVSTVHDASAAWQAGRWRVQYRFNRSHQDNRQVGRAQSDLIGTMNTLSLGITARANVDVSIDASIERQSNRELAQNTRLRRLGGTVNWRITPRTTLTAFASGSTSDDEPATNDSDNGELRFELARGFDLWRNTGGGGTRGQLFLRYANQSSTVRQLTVLSPDIPPVRTERDNWTLSSGVSLRLF